MLREYQQRSIDQLYQWLRDSDGNPVLVLPTGSGKSHIVAALCRDALTSWPATRILMMTHVSELIEQNAEKMRQHWPNAPMGIYSAGMRRRDIDRITFGSVQSLRGKAAFLGHRDLCLIDESHLINNRQQGEYRKLIDELHAINPAMRVVGLTATPYRLGQGMLTDGDDPLFDGIIEPVGIAELVAQGYLAPLKSKHTDAMIDTSKVRKSGGEFVRSQMAGVADGITQDAIAEIVARAGERRHWLLFCAGVEHAEHCRDELQSHGITAATITGKTPTGERRRIIRDYRNGVIQALTNADVLTTGFDAPDTDLIAFLRPTMSPALYVQMAGRGMRIKSHTDHCLILDFAGNVERHGPITDVRPPKARGSKAGEKDAPVKACPDCDELVHTSVMRCPECGHEWEAREKEYRLSNADIMGVEPIEMAVTDWRWSKHVSQRSGDEMVKVRYYGGLADPVVTEWHPVNNAKVGSRALAEVARIAVKAGLDQSVAPVDDMNQLADYMNSGTPPAAIHYHRRGRFYEIVDRAWEAVETV